MSAPQILIGGGNLTIEDLFKIEQGAQIVPDPDSINQLKGQASGQPLSEPFHLESSLFPRSSSAVRINSLLRKPAEIRAELVQYLCENISNPQASIQSVLSGHDWNENELKLFKSAWTGINVTFALGVHKLKHSLSLLDAAVATFMNVHRTHTNFIKTTEFSHISNGFKETLENLTTFLKGAKLTKTKDAQQDLIIQSAQATGALRDAVEGSWRNIERELNCGDFTVNKQQIERTPVSIVPLVYALESAANLAYSYVAQRQQAANQSASLEPLLVQGQAEAANFSGYSNLAQRFYENANKLELAAFEEIRNLIQQLIEEEAKLNEGQQKPRALPLGYGVKGLFTSIKEGTLQAPQQLAQFLTEELESKNQERRIPKVAKGMQDFGPEQMKIRDYVLSNIKGVFKNHMAGELETPVMELKETLTNKYGEEGSKLIYNLADQGGEMLSLRYDLTVPFARYVAMNRISKWKRFQIGKVYRRDQPQIKKGRFREFYQCDFDIVGQGGNMAQEAEVLKIVVEILKKFDLSFVLKINNRKLLDAILEIAGCSQAKFRTISSSIDKLDKEPWAKVYHELTVQKGISIDSANVIGSFMEIQGRPIEVVQRLGTDERITSHPIASETLREMETLINYLEALNILPNISFDLSLARGLDYYTGLVYEAVLTDNSQGVGSIAGGGRYDELIMRLNNSKTPVPAIGVSLGVERLFAILEARLQNTNMNPKSAVLVCQAGSSSKYDLMQERWKICNLLWENGIPCETTYKPKPNPKEQLEQALKGQIPWTVWVGEEELDNGQIRVKKMDEHSEATTSIDSLVPHILSLSN